MEGICIPLIAVLYVIGLLVSLANPKKEHETRRSRSDTFWTRDLGMFFLLGDLADGDLDGSFFFIDGDTPDNSLWF